MAGRTVIETNKGAKWLSCSGRRIPTALGMVMAVCLPSFADAQIGQKQDGPGGDSRVSPARQINHDPDRRVRDRAPPSLSDDEKYRTIDGGYNNLGAVDMGTAHSDLYRLMDADYGDGLSTMAGTNRPGAREISNAVAVQIELMPNPLRASDFLWQWGQFLDHDIDLTDGVDPAEHADILVPAGDQYFDPTSSGTVSKMWPDKSFSFVCPHPAYDLPHLAPDATVEEDTLMLQRNPKGELVCCLCGKHAEAQHLSSAGHLNKLSWWQNASHEAKVSWAQWTTEQWSK